MFLEATIPIATNEQLQQALYAIRNISNRSIVRYENNKLEIFVHLQEAPLENIPVLLSHLGITRMVYIGVSEKELETLSNMKKDGNFANLNFENLTVPVPSFSEEKLNNIKKSDNTLAHTNAKEPLINNHSKAKVSSKKRKNKQSVKKSVLPDTSAEAETKATVSKKVVDNNSNINSKDEKKVSITQVQEEKAIEQQLIEKIDQSSSLLECGQNLSTFCNIPKRAIENFITILDVATNLYSSKTEYSWSAITSGLKERNMNLTYYNRSLIIKATQENINKAFFEFLDIVTPRILEKFQSYFTGISNETQKLESTTLVESTSIQKSDVSEIGKFSCDDNAPTKSESETESTETYTQLLKCMPKITSAANLDEVKKVEKEILSIDKSLPLQEKISKLIELMGDTTWKNNTEHLSISETLFFLKNFNAKCDIPIKKSKHYLIWAKRIRNFSYLYNPNSPNRILASDFIMEIRQYIMSEEELSRLK